MFLKWRKIIEVEMYTDLKVAVVCPEIMLSQFQTKNTNLSLNTIVINKWKMSAGKH